MMKTKLLLCFLLLVAVNMAGQRMPIKGCYNDNREKGISFYKKKQYDKAISYFELAKDCPDKPSKNDLDTQIRMCRQEKKKIEDEQKKLEEAARRQIEEQRREEERREEQARIERERQARDREIANKGYMQISRVAIANGPGGGEPLINDYGSTIYASDVKYLFMRLYCSNLSNSTKKVTLYQKIYKPDGTLMKGSSSPSGYTYSAEVTLNTNTTYVPLSGWGNKSGGAYVPGTYKFEIWYNSNKLYNTTFTLYKKANEASRLTVDSKTAVSSHFSKSGGTETFYVSTDASEWTTWGVPSWCSIQNKESGKFTLKCQPNTSTSERSDYMCVKAGDKEVRIDITQEASKPSAEITSITQSHNVMNGFVKGMRIHLKFSTHNMKGKRITATAWFYYGDNTTKLNNGFGGQVNVSDSDTAPYEDTDFTMNLFLPYQSLRMMGGGSTTLSFDIVLTDSSGSQLARKNNQTFTYSQMW